MSRLKEALFVTGAIGMVAAGGAACNNNQEISSTPTSSETQTSIKLFDFPLPRKGASCSEVFSHIYKNFDEEEFVVRGKYIIFPAPRSFPEQHINLVIFIRTVDEEEFNELKALAQEELDSWLDEAGLDPQKTRIIYNRGDLFPDPNYPGGKYPRQYQDAAEEAIGAESGCI